MKPPDLASEDHLFARLHEEEEDELVRDAESLAMGLRSEFFSHQRDFISDPWPQKAINCPRRTGKSRAIGGALVLPLYETDDAKTLYLTLTATQSKRNMWELLQKWNKAHGLGAHFHHTELYMRSPRNGVLYLGGAETEVAVERYRGMEGGIDVAAIDEVDSFDKDTLKYLIKDVLTPMLYDRNGQLILGGTPGPILAGLFYELTGKPAFEIRQTEEGPIATSKPYRERDLGKWTGIRSSWSFHHWPMSENLAAPWIWQRALEMHKLSGDSDLDPSWRRESLGEWVEDLSALVYRYDEERNAWDPVFVEDRPHGLPPGHAWRFLAGVDPGYDDAFSLQVGAWAPTCRDFYHVDGFSESGLTISQAAGVIKEWQARFGGFHCIVADTKGLGKVYFEEMKQKHGIFIIPAAWSEKRDSVEIANSELLAGRAKIRRGSGLERQMRSLQWKNPKDKSQGEHPKQPNDACDAWLYQVRYSLHHFSRAPGPALSGVERHAAEEERAFQAAVARTRDPRRFGVKLRGAADRALDGLLAKIRSSLREA